MGRNGLAGTEVGALWSVVQLRPLYSSAGDGPVHLARLAVDSWGSDSRAGNWRCLRRTDGDDGEGAWEPGLGLTLDCGRLRGRCGSSCAWSSGVGRPTEEESGRLGACIPGGLVSEAQLSGRSSIILRNSACIRMSSVSSGWKAVASMWSWRTATGLPSSSFARTRTLSPTLLKTGARMKTARYGGPSTPSISKSVSKLSTCRPKAFRLTLVSIKPSGSGLWSVRCPAITIIPAQVPQAGIRSDRMRSRSLSRIS